MSDKLQDEINERANEKSRKRKEARDRMLATKTIEKNHRASMICVREAVPKKAVGG